MITNPTGADIVDVTMTPVRWAMIKVNINSQKKTLQYNPYTAWLKPSFKNATGSLVFSDALNDWNTGSSWCSGYFYVPDFNSASKPRMFNLSFAPYYNNSENEEIPLDNV